MEVELPGPNIGGKNVKNLGKYSRNHPIYHTAPLLQHTWAWTGIHWLFMHNPMITICTTIKCSVKSDNILVRYQLIYSKVRCKMSSHQLICENINGKLMWKSKWKGLLISYHWSIQIYICYDMAGLIIFVQYRCNNNNKCYLKRIYIYNTNEKHIKTVKNS